MNGDVDMSRAFEDEQDKQARMEAARKYYNGEQQKCDNCGHLFYPNENDPEQFVCDKCIEHAMNRD